MFSFFDICSFQPDDYRNRELHRFRGIDNSLRNHVHFHDPAENVYQDRFHIFIRDQNFKRFGYLLFGRATANVEKVGRTAAVKFDDVHRRHRQAGAIHQTSNVSVEADVVQFMFRRLDFARIFLRNISHRGDLRMSIKRIVIEIEFCIEREHVALLRHHQRIDFHHRTIATDERSIKPIEQFHCRLCLRLLESELLREFARLKWLEAGQRIDWFANNFVRRFGRNGFDLHATFSAGHNQRRSDGAI